jgi:hypothetical protein
VKNRKLIYKIFSLQTVFIFAAISNSEVKLNNYSYPAGAHVVGWLTVVIILAPLPYYFFIAFRQIYKKYKFQNLKAVRFTLFDLKVLILK